MSRFWCLISIDSFAYSLTGDTPLAGDWDGDGADTIGIYRPTESGFFLNLLNPDGTVIMLGFGETGDLPIVGDWDGQYTGLANRQLCHSYDALSRLVETLDREVRHDGQAERAYAYTYDLRSNRTAQTATSAGVPTLTTYTYDLANRLTSADGTPFSYDPNGNLLSDGALSYTYDAADRLTSAGGVSYTYNGLGARLTQTVGAVTTRYLLDLQAGLTQVLAETTGSTTRRYLHGHDIVAQQTDTAWAYFLYDGLGSVRDMSDAHGALFNNLSYDPYGVPYHSASETPLGFTGEHTDPNGLLYLRARYYAPTHGLFLTRDPVEGVWERLASRNGYGYVEGNPTNWTDPSGMTPLYLEKLDTCSQERGACEVACLKMMGASLFPTYLQYRLCLDLCLLNNAVDAITPELIAKIKQVSVAIVFGFYSDTEGGKNQNPKSNCSTSNITTPCTRGESGSLGTITPQGIITHDHFLSYAFSHGIEGLQAAVNIYDWLEIRAINFIMHIPLRNSSVSVAQIKSGILGLTTGQSFNTTAKLSNNITDYLYFAYIPGANDPDTMSGSQVEVGLVSVIGLYSFEGRARLESQPKIGGISVGDSGGGLFNKDGDLLGVIHAVRENGEIVFNLIGQR